MSSESICSCCRRKFGVFVRTRKACSECHSKACSACCKLYRLTVLGWASDEARRLCQRCFEPIDAKLRLRSANEPAFARAVAADREASTVHQLKDDVSNASTRVPEPSPQDDNDDDNDDDDDHDLPAGAQLSDDKNKCARCATKFGWLRRRRLVCQNCHDALCSACCGVYQFKALGWAQPRRCCFQCSEDLAAVAASVRTPPQQQQPQQQPQQPLPQQQQQSSPLVRRHSLVDAAAAAEKAVPEVPPVKSPRAQAAALTAAERSTLSPQVFATLRDALRDASTAIADGGAQDDDDECRLCGREVGDGDCDRRLVPALDANRPSLLCAACLATSGVTEAPLTATSELPHRVPLHDVALAAQCALPPHACAVCWRALRWRLSTHAAGAAAVASGDRFFALLAALTPPPAALAPLSRAHAADALLCHAHAIASNHLCAQPPHSVVDLSLLTHDILCAACNAAILDSAVESVGLLYHNACFACAACARNLASEEFFLSEIDNRPMCADCIVKN